MNSFLQLFFLFIEIHSKCGVFGTVLALIVRPVYLKHKMFFKLIVFFPQIISNVLLIYVLKDFVNRNYTTQNEFLTEHR
jgi:ABC-type sugar transport system permease subunit